MYGRGAIKTMTTPKDPIKFGRTDDEEINRILKDEERRLKKKQEASENKGFFDQLKKASMAVSKVEGSLSNFKKEITFDEKIFTSFSHASTQLGWLGIVITGLLLPLNAYKIFYGLLVSKDDHASRAVQVTSGLAGIALGVTAFLITAGVVYIALPIIVIIGAAKALSENLWWLGKSVRQYFSKQEKIAQNEIDSLKMEVALLNEKSQNYDAQLTKLTEKINQRRHLNIMTVNQSHLMVQAGIALTGAIFLFTPLAPVGVIIIAAITLYSVLDIADMFDPLKMAARGINALSKKLGGRELINFSSPTTNAVLNILSLNPLRFIGRAINILAKKIMGKPIIDAFNFTTKEEVLTDVLKNTQNLPVEKEKTPSETLEKNTTENVATEHISHSSEFKVYQKLHVPPSKIEETLKEENTEKTEEKPEPQSKEIDNKPDNLKKKDEEEGKEGNTPKIDLN